MSKRILVVDDQEDLRGVLRDLLIGSGYTVIEAAERNFGADQARIFGFLLVQKQDVCCASHALRRDTAWWTSNVLSTARCADKRDLMPLGQLSPRDRPDLR